MNEPAPNIVRPKPPARSDVNTVVSLDEFTGYEILEEKPFRKMLFLERKRTERSGRRFVLMLLEAGSLLKAGSDEQVLGKVLHVLSHSTRETDIKGWYEECAIIGVIFTEIDPLHGKAVANALLTRVTTALCSTLSIEDINEIHLSFHVFPEENGGHGQGGGPTDLLLYPDLAPDRDKKKVSRMLKRSMDVVGSLAAITVLSPALLAVSLAVRLTSKGPILFRQERVGQYGSRFTFLKFRSMYSTNDHTIHQEFVKNFIAGNNGSGQEAGSPRGAYKLTNDPRVTPVGKFIRRTSLDELPQFLNVLRGEMSLVGPRPAIPYEVECYDIWHKHRVLAVKPGITGLWQVGGRSRVQFDEMIRLDLRYARSWSLWMDIKILLATPGAVFSRNGAY